jgi:hypothetical protein
MPSQVTRTYNPLPFTALEPKRFEDLIRQLAYDFRQWRMLEATGRSGSDDGYDARGFEIVDGSSDEPEEPIDSEEPSPSAADRQWLIQCKREKTISPAKLRAYLNEIADPGALYGVIFAAACDFSKRARDDAFAWARRHGIAELHIWGRAEVEDQLFQPKNDHLLFAYFGISLQIRKRSVRTALRAKLTMKRKVMRHLGEGWNDNKLILLRDPSDENYPYIEPDDDPKARNWHVVSFVGNHLDCIKLKWGSFYAYLSLDGKHWDYANAYNDRGLAAVRDPWIFEEESERLYELRTQITEFLQDKISEPERARFEVECLVKYDDIIEIDERGDNQANFPHVFVNLKNGRPANATYRGVLRATGMAADIDQGEPPASRIIRMPELVDRIEIFPKNLRFEVR